MSLTANELRPEGQEVVFKRTDGVLLLGVRQETGVWSISLPDADSTIDPSEVVGWDLRSRSVADSRPWRTPIAGSTALQLTPAS